MNTTSLCVGLMMITTAGCVAGPDESAPESEDTVSAGVVAISEGDYVIHPVHSNQCLDISAASTANGARVQQWGCNGTAAQVFRLIKVADGYYEIVNPHSDKALDVRDVSYAAGAPLQQWGYGGGQNQQFQILPLGNGEFSIRARHTGFSLDIDGWSQAAGATVLQWPWHGGANQRFRFDKVGGEPANNGWKLAWSDEFNGAPWSAVDGGKWAAQVGGSGWGNGELEYYTGDLANVHQENGALVITATPENASKYGCWYGTCQFTSARLVTQGKFERTYGRVEARIQIPRGQGIWPAFWMLGSDIGAKGWPGCGEIDIMENIGKEPSTVHGSMHGPGYSGATPETAVFNLPGGARFADGFHLFSVEWEPQVVRFYVDDTLYQTRTPADLPPGTPWVFDHPFFLLLNVAVGGGWPGSPDGSSPFPQRMLVDYVRVYGR
jgi:beta-glucanase (GH16 family)